MRKSITLSALVAGLLAAVLMTGPVAQAQSPTIPPEVRVGCGARPYPANYSACVTVVNATRGFTAPGRVDASAGFAFDGAFSVFGSNAAGRRGYPALLPFSGLTRQLEAGNGWVAFACEINYPYLHGCGTEVITSLSASTNSQVTAGNRALQTAVVRDDPNPTNTMRGQVLRRTDISDGMWTCADASRYVACERVGWQGSIDHARFNYRLVNKTVAIRLTNNLPHRLELRESQWGQTIADDRGKTPATTLASGQRNSARSVAPDVEGFAAPVVWWGGIRPISRANTNVSLSYDVTGAGQYQGVQIDVNLRFDADGNVKTNGACRATGRTSNVPFCDVSASSSGGATQLNVSLRAF
jgi:hypothetical protein